LTMSDVVPSSSDNSSTSLITQLCEITGIDKNCAQKLLLWANNDLNVAVYSFMNEGMRMRSLLKDEVIAVESDDEKVKDDLNVLESDDEKGLEKDFNSNDKFSLILNNKDEENNANKASNDNDKKDGSNAPTVTDYGKKYNEEEGTDDCEKYNEEEELEKALEASAIEFQLKEPDALETFHILSRNFPQIDSTALRELCIEYGGRSGELEKFVQHDIYKLPTKLEAEKSKLKTQLEELLTAGIEEAKDMVIEDCPGCKKPKIVEDVSVKVFICQNSMCEGEFCRKCLKAQHMPYECDGKVNMWDETLDFQTINMWPKRSFDENDELDKEFRLAEGQFLRLNALTNQNYKIQSIELVHNKNLEAKFEAKKEELKKQGIEECLLLFHGTAQKNIQPILERNFDISIIANGRIYGNGVYFSECPEVSMGYSDDQKSLVLCKVLTGNNSTVVKDPNNPNTGFKRKRDDERFWAIVVPDVDQILPKYVINFT